jgi:hypothetical protein
MGEEAEETRAGPFVRENQLTTETQRRREELWLQATGCRRVRGVRWERGKEWEMERLEGTEQNHRDTEKERQKEKVKGQKDGNGSGLQTATAQTAGTPIIRR